MNNEETKSTQFDSRGAALFNRSMDTQQTQKIMHNEQAIKEERLEQNYRLLQEQSLREDQPMPNTENSQSFQGVMSNDFNDRQILPGSSNDSQQIHTGGVQYQTHITDTTFKQTQPGRDDLLQKTITPKIQPLTFEEKKGNRNISEQMNKLVGSQKNESSSSDPGLNFPKEAYTLHRAATIAVSSLSPGEPSVDKPRRLNDPSGQLLNVPRTQMETQLQESAYMRNQKYEVEQNILFARLNEQMAESVNSQEQFRKVWSSNELDSGRSSKYPSEQYRKHTSDDLPKKIILFEQQDSENNGGNVGKPTRELELHHHNVSELFYNSQFSKKMILDGIAGSAGYASQDSGNVFDSNRTSSDQVFSDSYQQTSQYQLAPKILQQRKNSQTLGDQNGQVTFHNTLNQELQEQHERNRVEEKNRSQEEINPYKEISINNSLPHGSNASLRKSSDVYGSIGSYEVTRPSIMVNQTTQEAGEGKSTHHNASYINSSSQNINSSLYINSVTLKASDPGKLEEELDQILFQQQDQRLQATFQAQQPTYNEYQSVALRGGPAPVFDTFRSPENVHVEQKEEDTVVPKFETLRLWPIPKMKLASGGYNVPKSLLNANLNQPLGQAEQHYQQNQEGELRREPEPPKIVNGWNFTKTQPIKRMMSHDDTFDWPEGEVKPIRKYCIGKLFEKATGVSYDRYKREQTFERAQAKRPKNEKNFTRDVKSILSSTEKEGDAREMRMEVDPRKLELQLQADRDQVYRRLRYKGQEPYSRSPPRQASPEAQERTIPQEMKSKSKVDRYRHAERVIHEDRLIKEEAGYIQAREEQELYNAVSANRHQLMDSQYKPLRQKSRGSQKQEEIGSMERRDLQERRTYEQPPSRQEFVDPTPPPQALRQGILRDEPFSARAGEIPPRLINENSEGRMDYRAADHHLYYSTKETPQPANPFQSSFGQKFYQNNPASIGRFTSNERQEEHLSKHNSIQESDFTLGPQFTSITSMPNQHPGPRGEKISSKSSDRFLRMQRVQPEQEISNFDKNESIPRAIFREERASNMGQNSQFRAQSYKPPLPVPQKNPLSPPVVENGRISDFGKQLFSRQPDISRSKHQAPINIYHVRDISHENVLRQLDTNLSHFDTGKRGSKGGARDYLEDCTRKSTSCSKLNLAAHNDYSRRSLHQQSTMGSMRPENQQSASYVELPKQYFMHVDKENIPKDKMGEPIQIQTQKSEKMQDFVKKQKPSQKSAKHQPNKTVELIQQISAQMEQITSKIDEKEQLDVTRFEEMGRKLQKLQRKYSQDKFSQSRKLSQTQQTSKQDLTVESKSLTAFNASKAASGIASVLDRSEISGLDKKRASSNSQQQQLKSDLKQRFYVPSSSCSHHTGLRNEAKQSSTTEQTEMMEKESAVPPVMDFQNQYPSICQSEQLSQRGEILKDFGTQYPSQRKLADQNKQRFNKTVALQESQDLQNVQYKLHTIQSIVNDETGTQTFSNLNFSEDHALQLMSENIAKIKQEQKQQIELMQEHYNKELDKLKRETQTNDQQEHAKVALQKLMDQDKFNETVIQLNKAVEQKQKLEQKLYKIKAKLHPKQSVTSRTNGEYRAQSGIIETSLIQNQSVNQISINTATVSNHASHKLLEESKAIYIKDSSQKSIDALIDQSKNSIMQQANKGINQKIFDLQNLERLRSKLKRDSRNQQQSTHSMLSQNTSNVCISDTNEIIISSVPVKEVNVDQNASDFIDEQNIFIDYTFKKRGQTTETSQKLSSGGPQKNLISAVNGFNNHTSSKR